MTREQACNTLRNAAWLGTNEDRERIERAVELLCGEPCEDAISRRAVHEAITRWAGSMGVLIALPTREVRPLLDSIHELPPVTPKQEPCEDVISRQAAIDAFSMFAEYESNRTNAEWVDRIRVVLSGLPPVQPISRWIPVSERLSEDGQSVLFCDIDNDIMVGYHVKGRPDTHFSQDGTNEDIKNVRAWMPLPEPYTEESEEQS